MKRTKKILIIVFTGILLILLGLYIGWKLYFTDARMYKEHWNITLPSTFTKQYDVSSFGALGDGSSYTIYGLKDTNTSLLEGVSSKKNTAMESDIIRILKALRVDDQKYPIFSHPYKWKILSMKSDSRNKLYIIDDADLSLVYLIQEFR